MTVWTPAPASARQGRTRLTRKVPAEVMQFLVGRPYTATLLEPRAVLRTGIRFGRYDEACILSTVATLYVARVPHPLLAGVNRYLLPGQRTFSISTNMVRRLNADYLFIIMISGSYGSVFSVPSVLCSNISRCRRVMWKTLCLPSS